ncbi:MAG: MFS transporter [Chloroflexota bacterium]|nr:MFS transporter [Chloroflexota bacterium]
MTGPTPVTPPAPRSSAWLERWGPLLPLLVAEFIVWVGFGGLLPIMPLYFTQHGVDLGGLGIVIAAWPAARLVGEPIFGWIADRSARVPLMVVGLVVTGIALGLPLVFTGPLEFLLLRALAGFATAIYDPAARGYLTDATPPERRGEAFGLYGAAQMGGLLLGPAIGGVGAAVFGGVAFVFVFGALVTLLAAVAVALRVRESAQVGRRGRIGPAYDITEFPTEPPVVYQRAADDAFAEAAEGDAAPPSAPASLWNRRLIAAIFINLGGYFAGGTYEVIWSVFLLSKGAGLDLIGLTFAMFALPVLIVSPLAGRLIDRRGSFAFVVVGSVMMATPSFIYPLLGNPLHVIPFIIVEGTGFAILNPALYAIVAGGSPRGRTSTAQGVFGASGTLGTIVASVLAGYLAGVDLRYPFWVAATVMYTLLIAGVVVGGAAIRRMSAPGGSFDPVPSA